MRRRRRIRIITACCLIVVLSVLDHAGVFGFRGNDWARYDGAVATVTYAADGDTIDINMPDGRRPHTRIRLCGIDCPEIAHAPGESDAYYGREATQYVRQNVVGRLVRLAIDPSRRPRGKYGRLLAYVYLLDTGEMLNEQLIRLGLAYADRRFEHVFKHRFVKLDKAAMKNKVGLWASVKSEQMPAWRQRMDAAGAW